MKNLYLLLTTFSCMAMHPVLFATPLEECRLLQHKMLALATHEHGTQRLSESELLAEAAVWHEILAAEVGDRLYDILTILGSQTLVVPLVGSALARQYGVESTPLNDALFANVVIVAVADADCDNPGYTDDELALSTAHKLDDLATVLRKTETRGVGVAVTSSSSHESTGGLLSEDNRGLVTALVCGGVALSLWSVWRLSFNVESLRGWSQEKMKELEEGQGQMAVRVSPVE